MAVTSRSAGTEPAVDERAGEPPQTIRGPAPADPVPGVDAAPPADDQEDVVTPLRDGASFRDASDSLGYLLGRAALVEQRVRELVAERRAGDPAPDDPFRGLYLTEDAVDRAAQDTAGRGASTVDARAARRAGRRSRRRPNDPGSTFGLRGWPATPG